MITKEEFESAYNVILCYKKQLREEMLKINRLPQVVSRDVRLDEMDLSVRALHCLRAADINTIGELMNHDLSKLQNYRHIGKKTITELKELLDGIILRPL